MSAGAWVQREWSSIRPGDFVLDPQGTAFRIHKRDILGDIWVEPNDGSRPFPIGKQSGSVTVWDGSLEAENLEAFCATLGAKVIYDQH